jgi:D-alanine-D-alanine ligase
VPAVGRIVVLHNTDGVAVDASSVEGAAHAVTDALEAAGRDVERVGVHGTDVFGVLARLRDDPPALVFNLCESMAGDPRNEPTFVGLLDLFGLRYTGGDLLCLASCLHKQRCKEILIARGVSTPPYRYCADEASLADLDALDYPWFLKLAHEDASIGITEANVVHAPAAFRRRAREMMHEYRQPVLAERYVAGREVNVGFIGNGAGATMLPLHEIDFAAMPPDRPNIVSYAAKWHEDHVDYAGTKPVPMRGASPALVAAIDDVARAAWLALGLRDYGRVDLRIDEHGTPWVIDINPNCDVSPDAGMARAARVAGLDYGALIAHIVDEALAREG